MKTPIIIFLTGIVAIIQAFLQETTFTDGSNSVFPNNALTQWVYHYAGDKDSIPCRYYRKSNREWVVITGYDINKDTLYIAGGNPLVIACFKKEKLIYRRKILNHKTNIGLFARQGDSLYIVDDIQKELVSMHKNGEGTIIHKHLSINNVEEGKMTKDSIIIVCPHIGKQSANDLFYFNYQGLLLRIDKQNENNDPLTRHYYDNTRYCYDYKGEWKGYDLIVGGYDEQDNQEIALVDKKTGNVVHSFKFPYKLKHNCTSNRPYMNINLNDKARLLDPKGSPNSDILHDNHLYMMRYHECEKKIVYINEIDLNKAFQVNL